MFRSSGEVRVFINPEDQKDVKSFQLATFSDVEEERRSKKLKASEDFKPDFEGLKEKEFVLGGFDFEYHGGYRHDEILKKTTDEVDAMLAEAHSKVASIEESASQKGYTDGFEKGKQEARRELLELIEALNSGLEQTLEVRNEFFSKAEKEMVDIVTLVATEIIRREVKTNPEIIKEVIRNTVAEVTARQSIHIRLNPVDIEAAKEIAPELLETVENVKDVTYSEDPTISEGGCVIETDIGKLDATVENRLMAIYRNLRQKVL